MVPAGNKAKRLSSVNHTTKTIHFHHKLVLLLLLCVFLIKRFLSRRYLLLLCFLDFNLVFIFIRYEEKILNMKNQMSINSTGFTLPFLILEHMQVYSNLFYFLSKCLNVYLTQFLFL